MPKFETFGKWIEKKWGSQKELAKKLGVAQNTISQYLNGKNRIRGEMETKVRALGYDGPLPHESNAPDTVSEESPPYIRDYNPGEYAAEAFLIVAEAARAGGAPLDSLEPKAVAEVIGSIADAVAQGRGEEARLRLVRKAETILQAMKR